MLMSEIRKVQRTPSGTFFVTLPKSWAGNRGLKRGSIVSIKETNDGRLVVDPEHGVERPPRSITLGSGAYLSREIVGKYLLGFDIIRVEAKKRISLDVRNTVKKAANRLIGLEIVEEDYSGIVLQCLLDHSGLPPMKILHRGYAIACGMHRDVVNSLISGDIRIAESVMARDNEVNRLYFLLVRILRTVVQNPGLSEKLGVRPIDCLDYRLAGSLVEAIGDECVRIALKAINLHGAEFTEELKRSFIEFHEVCFEAQEDAMNAFFRGDVGIAEGIKDTRGKIEEIFTNIERITKAESLDIVPQILTVASIMRQIYEHSIDIADLVMPKKV